MIYTVSITSQGQISIPAPLRRKLGLNKKQKALISEDGGKLVVEPIKDFLQMKGSLRSNKPPLDPKKLDQLFGEYLAKEAIKGQE